MQGRVAALLAALGMVGSGAWGVAAEREDRGTPVYRSGIEVVSLSVTVTDRQGRFVPDLSRDDFEVFENGVAQELRVFERSHVPIDLAILIDTSASMNNQMHTVQAAALSFIGTLGAADRASVVGFSHVVRTLQSWTDDRSLLEQAVLGTEVRGGTSLYTALYVALRSFEPPPPGEVRRQAIVVLSDGDDTSSLISYEDVFDHARGAGVSIYGISVKGEREALRRRSQDVSGEFVMRSLSRETGARAFVITSFDDLQGVYQSIAEEIANQYVLGYVPASADPERSYRRVQVRIGTRSDVIWRTRSGYVPRATSLRVAAP
jgi:Ca-activated chloride channel homolog